MSQYECAARTNYFAVRDMAAFQAAMAPFDVQIVHNTSDSQLVAVLSTHPDGAGWPSYRVDEETDETIEVDFVHLIAEHLADDYVAVLIEAGAEKLAYVGGYAVAVNHAGDIRTVSLDDIYGLAGELGKHVTQAAG